MRVTEIDKLEGAVEEITEVLEQAVKDVKDHCFYAAGCTANEAMRKVIDFSDHILYIKYRDEENMGL